MANPANGITSRPRLATARTAGGPCSPWSAAPGRTGTAPAQRAAAADLAAHLDLMSPFTARRRAGSYNLRASTVLRGVPHPLGQSRPRNTILKDSPMTQHLITRRQFALALVASPAAAAARAPVPPLGSLQRDPEAAVIAGYRFRNALRHATAIHNSREPKGCFCPFCDNATLIEQAADRHLAQLANQLPDSPAINRAKVEPLASTDNPELAAEQAGRAFAKALGKVADARGRTLLPFADDALVIRFQVRLYVSELYCARTRQEAHEEHVRGERRCHQTVDHHCTNHPLAEAAVIAGYRFRAALRAADAAHTARACDCHFCGDLEPMGDFIETTVGALAGSLYGSAAVRAAADGPLPADLAPRSSPDQRAIVAGCQLQDALDAVLATDWRESENEYDVCFWNDCWNLRWLARTCTDLLDSFVPNNAETMIARHGPDSDLARFYAAEEAGDRAGMLAAAVAIDPKLAGVSS